VPAATTGSGGARRTAVDAPSLDNGATSSVPATYADSEGIREVVNAVPDERSFSETADCACISDSGKDKGSEFSLITEGTFKRCGSDVFGLLPILLKRKSCVLRAERIPSRAVVVVVEEGCQETIAT
jgi:hypothetical protein